MDIDSLLISQPDTGEQALDIAETLVRSGAVDLLVVDSVAALVPRSELDGEIGDTTVGLLARLMSQAMRRLAGAISKSNSTVVFINQYRLKIGGYGPAETTPGGLALKYYASVRLEVRGTEKITENKNQIGTRTVVKVKKNKVAPPLREASFDILYGRGIDRVGEIVDTAVKMELIEKAGAWFTVGEDRLQGRDAVKQYLIENPAAAAQLESQIIEKHLASKKKPEDIPEAS